MTPDLKDHNSIYVHNSRNNIYDEEKEMMKYDLKSIAASMATFLAGEMVHLFCC